MAEVPWFMLSPSPISLLQYAILSWILSRHFLKTVEYKRDAKLFSLLDGFFVTAFFVLLGDIVWSVFCAVKWLPVYPGDLQQIFSSILRDLLGLLLFWMFIAGYFKEKVLSFSRDVKTYLICMVLMQGVWFWIAPSPAITDYTFAFRHGYPLHIVLGSLFLSHFLIRIPQWIAIKKTMEKTIREG